MNGKRPREALQEDQLEIPRKVARLGRDHHGKREDPQQPPHPVAIDSDTEQKYEFVDGPGHLVFIDERGKRCPAICFNKCLLDHFNKIAMFGREVRERDQAIQKVQCELERIKSSNQSARTEEAKRLVEEAIKNQEDIEAGFPGLTEARQQYENLTRKNHWPKGRLESNRIVAQLVIEQILSTENLIDIPSFKPQEPAEDTRDRSREPTPLPEKTAENVQTSNEPERDLAPSPTTPQTPTEIQERITPRQLALRKLRFAAEELTYYRDELTYMQEEYAQAVAAQGRYRREQYPNRPASTTQTDVDLIGLQKAQHATRKVIEAEEGYDRAEREAETLGLGDILADPRACFYGEVYNEFPERSENNAATVPVNRQRIEAWMAAVPDTAAVSGIRPLEREAGFVEVDDWDAKSVEVFESVSLFACDVYRTKIDQWQELAGRMREGEAEVLSMDNVR